MAQKSAQAGERRQEAAEKIVAGRRQAGAEAEGPRRLGRGRPGGGSVRRNPET